MADKKEKSSVPGLDTVLGNVIQKIQSDKDKYFEDALNQYKALNPYAGVDSTERLKPAMEAYISGQDIATSKQASLMGLLAQVYQNAQQMGMSKEQFEKTFGHQVSLDKWKMGWGDQQNALGLAQGYQGLGKDKWDWQNEAAWNQWRWDNKDKQWKQNSQSGSSGYGKPAGISFLETGLGAALKQKPEGGGNIDIPIGNFGGGSATPGTQIGYKPSYDYFKYGMPALAGNA